MHVDPKLYIKCPQALITLKASKTKIGPENCEPKLCSYLLLYHVCTRASYNSDKAESEQSPAVHSFPLTLLL